MRIFIAALICVSISAQAARGTLTFTTGTKRVELQVVEANHPALVTLRAEKGDSAVLRQFLLTHTGPEKLIAPNVVKLKEQAPLAWKVLKHRGVRLLQSDEAVYWCYTPGLVLPVRFSIGQERWELVSAELPPLLFVEVR